MPELQSTAADTLSSDSLDWALTHILRFGDTDIFPVPFEFKSVKHCWSLIKPALEELDLTDYRTRGTRRMLVPKPGAGFRVVTQLDPIDAIIYAALSYEAAPGVENSRIPRDRRIACSYRVDLDPKGRLFASESGWPQYHEHSKHLAETGLYTHVLLADIADFYNQIYSHRVQSALEIANVPPFFDGKTIARRACRRICINPTGRSAVKSSDYGQIPFLRLWGMELFQSRSDMLSPDAVGMTLAALHGVTRRLVKSVGTRRRPSAGLRGQR